MAQFQANMSGSSAYTEIFDVDENNCRWQLTVRKNSGSGYWTYTAQNWSVTIGPHTWSGTWTYDFRNASQITFASGRWGKPVLGATWGTSAYVAMGSLGSATAGGNVWIPGSATVPTWPYMYDPDQITTNSMRARFSSRGDGGSPVLQWQLQYARNSAFTVGAVAIDSSGTSIITRLSPATTYYFHARGRNAVGWGPWSGTTSGKTLSGAYYSDGSTWRACEIYSSNGSTWQLGEVNVSNGSAWRPAG